MRDPEGARRSGDAPKLLDHPVNCAHGRKGSPRLHTSASPIVASGHSWADVAFDDDGMEPDLDYAAIARRIKSLRRERKENQIDLAVSVGVARAMVAQYEAGTKKPGRDKLVAMARHFGMDVDQLIYGDRPRGRIKAESEAEERMLLLSRTVPDKVREAVLTILEQSAEEPGDTFRKPD